MGKTRHSARCKMKHKTNRKTGSKPNRRYEGIWRRAGYQIIAGIDEAGRGCLAGSVIAGAVILGDKIPAGINDSKKLSSARREELFGTLQSSDSILAWGEASAREIDQINIRQASFLAMRRAVEALSLENADDACPATTPEALLVDGFPIPDFDIPQRHLVRGDSRSLSIAAASIVAKVVRDRMMVKLSELYPGYGFEVHMGYPTELHREALARLGPTTQHRRSFRPVREWFERKQIGSDRI